MMGRRVVADTTFAATGRKIGESSLSILLAISFCHLLNDMVQSLVPSIYPILKSTYGLDFGQIGLITLTFQLTASLLQPLVGLYTDRGPKPFSLPIGMGFTLVGLFILSRAGSFETLLIGAALVGMGSAVFHPESSRVARMASGGRHGFAQSIFQVGGNAGTAIGPLLAAFIIVPHGQVSVSWFAPAVILSILILTHVGFWYRAQISVPAGTKRAARADQHGLSRRQVGIAITVLMLLIFSKFFYLASINSYFTFYLISKFHVSVQHAQLNLFLFDFAVAAGTVIGGPIGDRFGRKYVIWCSILGVLPFSLALPFASLLWTGVLSVVIGLILSSAFSAILVYAQELVPGRVGTISGLFFGFAFGMGGISAAILGEVADLTSIDFVYSVCSFVPALGILTALLPNLEAGGARRKAA
jgi:FSR family fosmidomycin resistance protein-like MFS transporter